FSAFQIAAYADSQPENVPFSKLSSTNMLKRLNEMLELDRFDLYIEKIKDINSRLNKEKTNVEKQLSLLSQKLEFLSKDKLRLEEYIKDFDIQKQEDLMKIKKELVEYNKNLRYYKSFLEE